MPDQKVMKIRLAKPGEVSPGDIVQCPRCCEKFVVLPGMVLDVYWDAQTQGPQPKVFEDRDYVVCPICEKITDVEYYTTAYAAGVELPPRSEPKPKEAKPDADVHKRSRKGTAQQRAGEQDRSKANRAKAGSARSKSDKGHG